VTRSGSVVLVLACGLPLALLGCRGADAESSPYEPAQVKDIAGSEEKDVTLTDLAAQRVSLETRATIAHGTGRAVPYAALIYDGQGATWVYVGTAPLTFRRTAVVVDRIEGDTVVLARGPEIGAPVVTVGATEVYGAELGIAGGH
jgi:hypothetical protein